MPIISASNLLSLADTGTLLVGCQDLPVTGIDRGGATYVFDQEIPSNGEITQILIFGGSVGGAAKIKIFSRAGNLFTLKSSQAVAVTPGVLNTLPTAIAVEKGDYLGFYSAGGAVFTGTQTAVSNPGYHYAGGDISSFTTNGPSNGLRFEVQFTVVHIVFNQRVARIADVAATTGHDTIVRDYRLAGDSRAQVGFQGADGQDPQGGFFRACAWQHASHYQLTSYQYGGTLAGFGAFGDTVELQLSSDVDPTRKPEFSVRDRLGRAGYGARLQVRNGSDLWGLWLSAQDESFPHFGIEDNEAAPDTVGLWHPRATGQFVFRIAADDTAKVTAEGIQVAGRATAPAPEPGSFIIWQKEDESEDAGDLMVTISSGELSVTARLVDFSELAPPPSE